MRVGFLSKDFAVEFKELILNELTFDDLEWEILFVQQIDVNNFFAAQVVPEIKGKTQVLKSDICVFLILIV